MLVKYKKQANAAAGLCLCTLIVIVAVSLSTHGNISESGGIPRIIFTLAGFVSAGAFWFALYAYAKAKGYSGFLVLVLPLFSVIGLVILGALRDKHPEPLTNTNAKSK